MVPAYNKQEGLEDIKLAHAEQLTQMRLPDKTIQLKSLNESQSVIIRKRKLRWVPQNL